MRLKFESRAIESHAYVPAIDALRALAVLAVMVFHLVPQALPGGFIGVDVFFVISGYVVAGSMSRDARLPFGEFIAAFYARRFRRIVPALVACLLATVIVSMALIPNAWLSDALRTTGLAAFFGLSNFALVATSDGYFATRTEFNPFTHTWSLAVEEQFYLLFPLLYYLCIPRGPSHVAHLSRWALVVLCVVSLGWCAWATTNSPSWAYYMLPSRFWELGLGAATFLLGDERRRKLAQRFGPGLLLASGLALIAWTLAFADKEAFPFPWALPAVSGALILLVSTADGPYRSRWGQALCTPPIVWIGLLSYSLYLWHWPVYTMMRWTTGIETVLQYVLALCTTFTLAWISYRYVESPPQRSRAVRRMPPLGVMATGVAVVVAGWGLASQIYARPWPFKRTVVEKNNEEWYPSRATPRHRLADSGAGCDVTAVYPGYGTTVLASYGCSRSPLHPDRRLFVAGDSHAGALTRMLDLAVRTTGIEVWQFSSGGCGLAYVVTPRTLLGKECVDFLDRTTTTILKQGRVGDVVLLESLRVARYVNQWGPVIDTLRLPADETAADLRLQAEVEALDLVTRFSQAGLKVVFVLPKPVFKAPPFRCSDWFNAMNPVCEQGFSIGRNEFLGHRRSAEEAIDRIVRATSGVFAWDPLPILCPADQCSAFDGNKPMYFDADHLSGHGNELLLPNFLASLSSWLQSPKAAAPTQPRRLQQGEEWQLSR